ncbi:hypothetical protein D3C73_1055690 [compost metagenome]
MNQGALSINGHMMSRSTSQVAAHCLAVTYQGLALQRKAPIAMPIKPKHSNTVCQASPSATCTISSSGERGVSSMAPR